MLTLTAAVSVPNIQRIHVDAVQLDGNTNVATVTCSVLGGGATTYSVYTLLVRDGACQGLRATVAPIGYQDRVEVFAATVATGFTDLVTASTGGITARLKAAESSLLAAGLLPAGTVA